LKFEHLLDIYWSNHFLYNGRIEKFDVTLYKWFRHVGGIQNSFKNLIIKRFELTLFKKTMHRPLSSYNKGIRRGINILLSQVSTVNNELREVVRLSIIRLYLIRIRRGRFHALGKPTRGQRTWSNAWSSFYSNYVLRDYIKLMQKTTSNSLDEDKKDYRKIARKYKKKDLTDVSAKKAKKLMVHWF